MSHRARWLEALRLVVLATLLLAVLEVGARALLPSRAGARIELFDLAGADGIVALEPVRDPGALLDAAYRIFERDRELVWRLRPDLDLDATELSIGRGPSWTVHTDGAGFRRSSRQGAQLSRVLAFGDSCTFGWGVEDHEAWPAVLSEIDDGRAVENLGVPGYSLAQGSVLLDRSEVAVGDAIVLAFGANDGHMTLWPDADVLAARRSWVGRAAFPLTGSRLVIAFQDLVYPWQADAAVARWRAGEAVARVDASHFREHLDAIAVRARTAGASVVLIDVCARDEYGVEMRAVSNAYGWSLIRYRDVHGATIDGCHPTPDGHRALAVAVAAAL